MSHKSIKNLILIGTFNSFFCYFWSAKKQQNAWAAEKWDAWQLTVEKSMRNPLKMGNGVNENLTYNP